MKNILPGFCNICGCNTNMIITNNCIRNNNGHTITKIRRSIYLKLISFLYLIFYITIDALDNSNYCILVSNIMGFSNLLDLLDIEVERLYKHERF